MDFWNTSVAMDDEFEKLVIRMNPPRVTVDNASSRKATLIKVDSANKRGSLLELVQALTDLDLIIRRAYISSDGEWFMDVFHVTDQHGNKLYEDDLAERIQQVLFTLLGELIGDLLYASLLKPSNGPAAPRPSSLIPISSLTSPQKDQKCNSDSSFSLGPRARSFRSLRRSVGVQAATEHTTIELTGRDRPGLLSEISAVLTDLKCNVVSAEVWTHNSRMASVVHITDEATGLAIDDPDRLAKIKQLLLYVLKGDRDKQSANTSVSVGSTHKERRLHQMMYADRDYDINYSHYGSASDRSKPQVTVENCADKGYTVINLRCPDRPKLLFDTVCTLTDMQYVVYHGTIIAEGAEAYQEYYIRHVDGCPISSEAERERVIHCLEAAIRRRTSEGVRLELCSEDRVGLLSEMTRIFRENGLSVTRAEITTQGTQAVNVFYVTDASGYPVKTKSIEAVREEIGSTILHVKEDEYLKSLTQESRGFSFGNMFRSRSEKFLYNLGLIKSCS